MSAVPEPVMPVVPMDVSEAVAVAVQAVPGVAALHGGAFGQVASYLPGRSVTGIRIRGDVTDVHVSLFWGAPVLATAAQIRSVVMELVRGLSDRVDVTIEDVVDPVVPVFIEPGQSGPVVDGMLGGTGRADPAGPAQSI